MTIKNIISSLAVVLISAQINAQMNMGMMDNWVDADAYTQMNIGGKQINLNDVTGTPLLYEDFMAAEIIQLNEENSKLKANLRYNVFKDVFEIKTKEAEGEIGTLEKSNQTSFILKGEEFRYFSGPSILFEYGESVNGYLAVIEEDEVDNKPIKLLKRYHKKFEPEQKPTSSYDTGSPAKFKSGIAYYAKVDGKYFKITTSKRKAYKDFPESHQDDIKKYMKKNKIKFRGSESEQEEELIDLIRYFAQNS